MSSLKISGLIKKKPGPQDGSIAQQASSGRVGTDLHMTGSKSLTAGTSQRHWDIGLAQYHVIIVNTFAEQK